jgi:hypothetical protein
LSPGAPLEVDSAGWQGEGNAALQATLEAAGQTAKPAGLSALQQAPAHSPHTLLPTLRVTTVQRFPMFPIVAWVGWRLETPVPPSQAQIMQQTQARAAHQAQESSIELAVKAEHELMKQVAVLPASPSSLPLLPSSPSSPLLPASPASYTHAPQAIMTGQDPANSAQAASLEARLKEVYRELEVAKSVLRV